MDLPFTDTDSNHLKEFREGVHRFEEFKRFILMGLFSNQR
jgi:hypothetical protein